MSAVCYSLRAYLMFHFGRNVLALDSNVLHYGSGFQFTISSVLFQCAAEHHHIGSVRNLYVFGMSRGQN